MTDISSDAPAEINRGCHLTSVPAAPQDWGPLETGAPPEPQPEWELYDALAALRAACAYFQDYLAETDSGLRIMQLAAAGPKGRPRLRRVK